MRTVKLAIHGGTPVRQTKLEYGHQWVEEDDIQAVVNVLRGDLITTGPKVNEFEEAFAQYVGAKYAVAVSSGTAALHLCCASSENRQSLRYLLPTLTFAATANAIIYCQECPQFEDIDLATLNLDIKNALHYMKQGGWGVLPVDLAGYPCNLRQLKKHARFIIEDACHALGATLDGKKVGNGKDADLTCFSLHPVKAITTGEGGIITTNNQEWAKELRLMRSHSLEKLLPDKPTWYYEINKLGFNYRMTDFQAALGLSQLKKLDRFIARRREIAHTYNRHFAYMPEIILPPYSEGHAWHLYIIQLDLNKLSVDRDTIFTALGAENVSCNVHYVPLHLQPFYQREYGYHKGDFPNAEKYYERCITLPLFAKMSDQDVQDVIDAVEKVITYYRKK